MIKMLTIWNGVYWMNPKFVKIQLKKAVTSTLKNPEINKFIKGPSIIESTALKIGLTSDLEVFEYFDTISNKIVYRPW